MKVSLKALLVKSLAIGTLAGVVALVAPAKAGAQGFGVAMHFGSPYRYDDWRRHDEWVRQQEWLRHQEWERVHRVYGVRGYVPNATPYNGCGR